MSRKEQSGARPGPGKTPAAPITGPPPAKPPGTGPTPPPPGGPALVGACDHDRLGIVGAGTHRPDKTGYHRYRTLNLSFRRRTRNACAPTREAGNGVARG